jgi:hypothetical protein
LEAERLRGLEVEHRFVPGRRLHGRLAGLVVQGENDAIVRVTVAGQPYAIDDRRN